jgi:hypothetical protein
VVCNDAGVGVRERVQRAIESPVAEAERVLAETPHAKPHERLSVLMTGWFRGIAGALDELAIELELLRTGAEPPQLTQHRAPPRRDDEPPAEETGGGRGADEGEATEAELAERARASREATAAVREERDSKPEGEEASGEPEPTASTPPAEGP